MNIKAKGEDGSKTIKPVVFVTASLHTASAEASWLKATIAPIMVFTGFVVQFSTFSPLQLFCGGGGVTCINSLHYNRATDQLAERGSPSYTDY